MTPSPKRPDKKGARKRAARGGFLRNAFLPTRINGRHPHLLRKEMVISVLALVLIAEVGCLSQMLVFSHSPGMTAAVLPAAVIDLTNQERSENSLGALTVNPLLTEAAQEKADDMAAKGYFAHVSPDGTQPWYWFQKVGYDYQYAGENLAIDFTDSTDVVNAWMNSPLHRANILKQQYTEIGIGIAQGQYEGHETTFVVQFFANPEPVAAPKVASATPAPKPAPAAEQKQVSEKPAAKPIAAAQTPAPQNVSPTVPVETQAPTLAPTLTSPSGEILGVQTPAAPTPLVQLTWYQKILASPGSYLTYLLIVLATFFITLLILSFLPLSLHAPHPDALMNGGALIAVLLGILIMNHGFFSRVNVSVPDAEHAAVTAAVRS